MINRIGQQLGNYRLIRLLGTGGFAEVYLGEHIHMGTQAAIKVLYTQLGQTDIEQFRNEARTIAHLEHPHIIRVLDFGVEGTTPFLVMSYAPNGTLRTRHPKGTPLPLATVVSYVQQVASALQYAHDEKLIHRDVKPENMLLGRRNEILLSDFGIALVAQSSRYQSAQEMAGTMAYMAPEQIQGKPRPASDQYALGIVIYEWLTADRPFHGSLTELVGQHLSVAPPPLLDKVSTVSSEVDRVVLTALAKDPKQRFDCIQTFADALHNAAQPSLSTIVPSSPIEASNVASPISLKPQRQTVVTASPSRLPKLFPHTKLLSQRWSRRMALLAGTLLIGGGITWFAISQGKDNSLSNTENEAYAHAVLADKPNLYYHFNEKDETETVVHDFSGNVPVHNGIYVGSVQRNQVGAFGESKPTITLAGDSGYVLTNTLPEMQVSADRTVEMWFKGSDQRKVALLHTGNGASGESMTLVLVPDGGLGGNGAPSLAGFYVNFYDSDVHLPIAGLQDGTWHYVAVSVTGNQVRVYLDGKQPQGYIWNGSSYKQTADNQPFQMPLLPNTSPRPIEVGSSFLSYGPFYGSIDELAIYPRALSITQIAAHYVASRHSTS